jgi:trigger factor
MKIDIKQKNDFLTELTVSLPWKDISKDYTDQEKQVLLGAKEKGARKGKLKGIQKDLFLKNNRDYINSSFVDFALNKYYQQALQEKDIIPINQGKVSKLEFEGENTNFSFTIEFEIRPILDKKLPNYEKKVTIKTNKYIATDKDIDQSIEDIRTKQATMKSLDNKSKLKSGHFIYADFTKLDDKGNPVENSTLPNHHIKIGEGLFSGELEKPFIGKKIDDIVNITVNQESGDIPYSVKINKIEEQILPKVNDEFAQSIDKNLKTVKDFRLRIKDNIQINLNNENTKEFNNKIIEYFLEKTKLDVPQSMVDNYKTYLIEDYKAKNPDSFDEDKMNEEFNKIANKNMKWLLIRDFLMNKEKISLSNQEVDDSIQDMIKQSPDYKKDIIKFYNDENNKNKFKDDILNKKFFSKLEKYFINKKKEIPTDKIKKNKG